MTDDRKFPEPLTHKEFKKLRLSEEEIAGARRVARICRIAMDDEIQYGKQETDSAEHSRNYIAGAAADHRLDEKTYGRVVASMVQRAEGVSPDQYLKDGLMRKAQARAWRKAMRTHFSFERER